jgi:SSS family solute:Na+ symporter
MNFAPIDWVIIAAYLAASMLIGLAGRRYVGSTADFLVAGRELGTAIGIATLAATEIGTITFMYNSELGYRYGFAAFGIALISGAAMIFVGRTGFVISKFRALRLMTVPEYFEIRYSGGLRLLTGILVALGGVLNMGIFLKVEGQFLIVVGGLNPHSLLLIMLAILLLELVYTSLGGMVSVVITDYMQYVLLSIASIIITISVVHVAGWHAMVNKVSHEIGPSGFNPFTSPKFGWKFLIWQVLLWLAVNTCWQTTAMRMFSTKSPETSRSVMTWTGFIFLGRGILPMLWGIAALVLFGHGHRIGGIIQPVVHGKTLAPIEAMPAMLAVLLAPGVRGLVVAGMLAATMSVNSSYLLGWSAVISQDIIAPLRKTAGRPALSDRSQLLTNRLCNLAVGLFLIFWGLYYTPPGAVYLYLNVTGTIFLAGGFVCVVGGLYWKRANVLGGYLAMLLGAVGAIVPFFFLHRSESFAGFAAFSLAAVGLLFGSFFRRTQELKVERIPAPLESQ